MQFDFLKSEVKYLEISVNYQMELFLKIRTYAEKK